MRARAELRHRSQCVRHRSFEDTVRPRLLHKTEAFALLPPPPELRPVEGRPREAQVRHASRLLCRRFLRRVPSRPPAGRRLSRQGVDDEGAAGAHVRARPGGPAHRPSRLDRLSRMATASDARDASRSACAPAALLQQARVAGQLPHPDTTPEDMLVDDSATAVVAELGQCLTEMDVHGRVFGTCSVDDRARRSRARPARSSVAAVRQGVRPS